MSKSDPEPANAMYSIFVSPTLIYLKGTATLIISTFYKKELFKLWILIPVSSKSVEKWGSYGHLKNSIWPTLSRHFEYLLSFQNFYNCLKRNRITKNIFNFRREWLERLTFCNKFYENRWIGFIDIALFIFLNV